MNYSLTFSGNYARGNSLFYKYIALANYIWWLEQNTEHKRKKILMFSVNFLKKVLILLKTFAIIGQCMSIIRNRRCNNAQH